MKTKIKIAIFWNLLLFYKKIQLSMIFLDVIAVIKYQELFNLAKDYSNLIQLSKINLLKWITIFK